MANQPRVPLWRAQCLTVRQGRLPRVRRHASRRCRQSDANGLEGGFLALDNISIFDRTSGAHSGAGLGAGHQTGWTGVVAKLIHQYAEYALQAKPGLGREYGLGTWDDGKQ